MTLIAALVAVMPALNAQEVYSLPKTSLSFEVETVIETFHAGPYAEYAKKYLGIEARTEDVTTSHITKVTMTPHVEADLSARYTAPSCDMMNLSSQGLVIAGADMVASPSVWRFPSEGAADFSGKGVTSNFAVESTNLYKTEEDGSYSIVSQNIVVEKSADKRAAEAADMVFMLRKTRIQIITGDTDMTYSGAAMGAAIDEMTKLEKEYLSLFVGYSESRVQTYNFEIIPDASKAAQKYVAFRLSDTDGAVAADNISGSPVVLELVPEPIASVAQAAVAPKGYVSVNYRIPAVCAVKLLSGTDLLLNSRVPVYQLGATATTFAKSK